MNKKQHDELVKRLGHLKVLQGAVAAGYKENYPVLLNAVVDIVREIVYELKPEDKK